VTLKRESGAPPACAPFGWPYRIASTERCYCFERANGARSVAAIDALGGSVRLQDGRSIITSRGEFDAVPIPRAARR
jgi:hypothetical protein